MKIKSAVFLLSAPRLEGCPPSSRPEIAFIGRSNVGKSSLINLLTDRRDLAKVSSTPGKTKLINFFLVNETWFLVDLPGYGYAQTGKAERELFSEMVAEYLEEREPLRHVFVLIDSRLSPQRIDLEFLGWLGARDVPFSLVFTKSDKLKATPLRQNVEAFLHALSEVYGARVEHFITSSKTKSGRQEILRAIDARLADAPFTT